MPGVLDEKEEQAKQGSRGDAVAKGPDRPGGPTRDYYARGQGRAGLSEQWAECSALFIQRALGQGLGGSFAVGLAFWQQSSDQCTVASLTCVPVLTSSGLAARFR